jgi:hypothetical protein
MSLHFFITLRWLFDGMKSLAATRIGTQLLHAPQFGLK